MMPVAFQAEYGIPSGLGALGLARLRKFSICDCLGSWCSLRIMGITLSFMNCMALTGLILLGAKTFDHPRARASAASPELEVVVLPSLIIARLMALRSNEDQSLSNRFSWADLPPFGRKVQWSFSMIFCRWQFWRRIRGKTLGMS